MNAKAQAALVVVGATSVPIHDVGTSIYLSHDGGVRARRTATP